MSPSQKIDSELIENLSVLDNLDPIKVGRDTSTSNDLLRLLASRQNILACWPNLAYREPSFDFQLLRQHYFVCNSPDSVRRVFLEEHDNYDRKSPQMRHALEPLLGDGLFVSDGELWRQRRESCAPAFENNLLPDFSTYMVESAQELVTHWEGLLLSGIQQVDMLNEMARLTARIIARTIFGDDISDDEASQVVDGFSEYQKILIKSVLPMRSVYPCCDGLVIQYGACAQNAPQIRCMQLLIGLLTVILRARNLVA